MSEYLGLFRHELEEGDLVFPARRVIAGVRRGLTVNAAAREAGVSPQKLAQWKRNPAFRAALKRKRGEPKIINLNDYVDRPRLGEPEPVNLTVSQQSILDRLRRGIGGW